ncbi:hypothetical protein TNCV_586091 [Trichonephila clavipes]|nr:hypothetical protein TNCV_586091 [Trichonephila clavipes]
MRVVSLPPTRRISSSSKNIFKDISLLDLVNLFQFSRMDEGIGSSQKSLDFYNSCNIILRVITEGENSPRGSKICAMTENLLEGMPIFGPAGTPTAIPTKLGYIVSGKIYAPPLKESIVNSSLNDQLSELWKLEEVPKTNAKIQIPDPCEESFQNR